MVAWFVVFRLRDFVKRDLADRLWNAERERGVQAGDDLDGNGIISADERVKESVEWLNALLRRIWVRYPPF